MALCGLWMFVHEYEGLVHDARLYAIQALRVLRSEDFANDLFFAFGSQDAWTLFPEIHALFISALGVAWTGLSLTLAAQALWVSGACTLFAPVARSGAGAFWGLAALVALTPDFGEEKFFHYGEGFLTARLFAEALTLWALALGTRPRLLSGLLVAIAAALHPIYGSIGAGALLLVWTFHDRRWGVLLLGGFAGAIGLAIGGVRPLSGLLHTMDADWRAVVDQVNSIYLPLSWSAYAFAGIVLDVIALGVGSLVAARASRPLLTSILAVALGGLLASAFADASNNLLLIQLQPSRALWLLAAAANFCMGMAAYALWSRENGGTALALLGAGFCGQTFPYVALALALPGAWLAYRLLAASSPAVPHGPSRLHRWLRPISVVLMAAGALAWAARPAFDRDLERGAGMAAMRQAIPEDASVYWHATSSIAGKGAQLVWFGLDRRPYFSIPQAAGIIFSRETGAEYARRAGNLAALDSEVYLQSPARAVASLRSLPDPSLEELRTACRASADLGFVVLGTAVGIQPAATWTPRAVPPTPLFGRRKTELAPKNRQYVYDCADLR